MQTGSSERTHRYVGTVAVHERCLGELLYCDIHDAYFCPNCDEWIESSCGDPECEHCPTRAARPSECSHDDGHRWSTAD